MGGGVSVLVDNRMNSVAMIEGGRNRDKEGGRGREKRRLRGKEKLKGREKE